MQDSARKTTSSFSASFDTKGLDKKSTQKHHDQVFQSSSAPEYSRGLLEHLFPPCNQNKDGESLQNGLHVPNLAEEGTVKSLSKNVTDSFTTDGSAPPPPPKASSPEKRSVNLQQREVAAAFSLSNKAVSFCISNETLLTGNQVLSWSAHSRKETLIRPQPNKSGGAEVPLVAPVAKSFEPSRISSSSLSSSVLQTNSIKNNPFGKRKKELSIKEKKNSEKAHKERERQREKAEIRRLQKLQCDFPEMTQDMSRRNYNDRNHTAENDDYANTNDQEPPVSNRISLARHDPPMNPPTPLFERLVTEEVHEIKSYARILESQNRRLAQLERVHGDLEARLQLESQGRQQLEATLEAREREWAKQLEQLESDRNHWRHLVQVEETKNNRLMEEVMRKEQEIRRMLQRKYDHDGRSVRAMPGRSATPTEKVEARSSPEIGRSDLRSPHDVLKASGSAEKVRLRNMEGLLQDFFGM
ncbi:hypothetical protein FisN_8Lh140 [Fistulifera solaris]|uniref:Uncharacterized protein n=1 Tax=Fistulifera solaris TaxID=1519565 RepID=A0A1Z5JDE8_FISSO|nr:hypothetical protein FisN_8Lh140 [Fistulifera solaris]|eukprot:GAX12040.1 hypothetical protein FisN_8Lh140 [Fistulifera solaris]